MNERRQLQALNAKIALVNDYRKNLEKEVDDCLTELKNLSECRRNILKGIKQKV